VRPAWPDCRQTFRGGFVARVELAASVFIEHAGGLFSEHPIEGIELRGVHPGPTTRRGRRCYVWDAGRAVRAPGWLPAEFVRVMTEMGAGECSRSVGYRRVEFATVLEARGALSRAVEWFGRTTAGLPIRD
jgi:hypothetical protein